MKAEILVGNTLMPTADQVIEIMRGPSAKGPKRCFGCQKEFEVGEAWLRYKSVADPKFGSYSIGIHVKCEQVKQHKAS